MKDQRLQPVSDGDKFMFDAGSDEYIDFISDHDYFVICAENGIEDNDLHKFAKMFGYSAVYSVSHVNGQNPKSGFLCLK